MDAEIEENLARGYSHDEARRAALLKFGNPLAGREKLWRQNTLSGLGGLARNLKYGAARSRPVARIRGGLHRGYRSRHWRERRAVYRGAQRAADGRCHSPIRRNWCGCVNAPWAMASVSLATRMPRGSLPSGKSRAAVSLAWRSAVMPAITSPARRVSSRRRSRQQHSRHQCSRFWRRAGPGTQLLRGRRQSLREWNAL